ncbi:MAG: hypothetical protein JSS79_05120 [Bacteroidetes bacterium]|nr:hypothetical protein [Bacteroidota bacterium]
MKNLKELLKLKGEKVKHIVIGDDGKIAPLTTGAKGTVSDLDDSILKEVFGEFPLSDGNVNNFKLLKSVKLSQEKKAKKEKAK